MKRFTVGLLALGLLMVAEGVTKAEPITVLPPHAVVAGKTIGQWGDEWWKWALSTPGPNDPFTDTTGANANANQSGPVFYVAGLVGGAGPVADRTFTVPADTYVLLPLINIVGVGGPDGTFPDTRTEALAFADHGVRSLFTSIDGVAIPQAELFTHREESTANFTIIAVANNPFDMPPGTYDDAFAAGYWLMLAPFTDTEQHILHFGGVTNDFFDPDGNLIAPSFTEDITDRVTATPEPGSLTLLGLGTLGLIGYAWRPKRVAGRK